MYQGTLPELIARMAVEVQQPDGSDVRAIGWEATAAIARFRGLTFREVEMAALDMDILPVRYLRNLNSHGIAEQRRLMTARVAVIGMGGLGGTVADLLCRNGVGSLVLVDGDRFEESNLNRQRFCANDTLGEAKVGAAKRQLRQINPATDISVFAEFLTETNAAGILEGATLAVDCLDDIPSRRHLERACRNAFIPLVSGAVAGASGHVTAVFPGDDTVSRLYAGDTRKAGAETVLGCLPHGVTFIAALQCAEALRILLTGESTLRRRLLLVDLTSGVCERLELA